MQQQAPATGRAVDGANAVDVQDFLNQHRLSPFQWGIFAICFLIVLLDGFDTAAIGFIAPSLLKEWGLSKAALAPLLSAALFGLAAGGLVAGPCADRFGRRKVLVTAVALFGAACTWSAFAADLTQLTILRFVTGLGLGAAMPNAVTLMSEYCPDQRRATLTNAMFCGFPLGAALGGFLAAWMIPHWGWRSVLLLGGATPVLLALLMLAWLPESVRYMVANKLPAARIRAALGRISATAAQAPAFCMREKAGAVPVQSTGLRVILSRRFVVGTVMIWLAYFMGLVIFYSLINWMPILFKEAGLDARTATLAASLFPLGGVGAVFLGWLMDRFSPNRVIALCFSLSAVSIYAIGLSAGSVGLLMSVVFLAGTLMNTAQSSLPALAASFYPTQGRATGVAWMMGVGRFGGVAGSFLVAELSRRQVGFEGIFATIAVAGVLATLALLVKHWGELDAPEGGAAADRATAGAAH
ncbi:4-hydroxybenzoate transporter [Massilia sp. WF1]|nr:4-hydroxybenzoate transporter [Massilia sp. WG5]KLU38168.1 4-hydroxybenzoate transporter [Massilia sp. WF1]